MPPGAAPPAQRGGDAATAKNQHERRSQATPTADQKIESTCSRHGSRSTITFGGKYLLEGSRKMSKSPDSWPPAGHMYAGPSCAGSRPSAGARCRPDPCGRVLEPSSCAAPSAPARSPSRCGAPAVRSGRSRHRSWVRLAPVTSTSRRCRTDRPADRIEADCHAHGRAKDGRTGDVAPQQQREPSITSTNGHGERAGEIGEQAPRRSTDRSNLSSLLPSLSGLVRRPRSEQSGAAYCRATSRRRRPRRAGASPGWRAVSAPGNPAPPEPGVEQHGQRGGG